jgi:glycosyltransferase involved in cell wall biosynthesis
METMKAGISRISVMYFSNTTARGGAEEHILTLLRGLDRKRFRLALVCNPIVAEALSPDLPPDVETFPVRFDSPLQIRAGLRLAGIIRRIRPDVLHSHLFCSSLYASPIAWLCRVPVILETPHVREKWRTGRLKSGFAVDRIVGRFVTGYIAVSAANASYLVNEKGLPAGKVTTILNGSDLSRFDPGHRVPPELKGSLGIGTDEPVLIAAGRLEPQKGHEVLLAAMPAVLSEFPQCRLVCVGDGSLWTELERQAITLGISESVRFVGYQSNIQDWLALADVSVLASHYEGLPLIAIESLAAGRPVVATAVDGTPEVVVDGVTGLTVPPGKPAELAGAIRLMLRSAELRRTCARSGRQWVLKRFSETRQIEETQDLYIRTVARATGEKMGAFVNSGAAI